LNFRICHNGRYRSLRLIPVFYFHYWLLASLVLHPNVYDICSVREFTT
jgi:hypothetical protein